MSNNLQEFADGELVKLVTEKWIGRVIEGFRAAILYSFQSDLLIQPVMTRSEIERRFTILINWFIVLRRDLHWSVPRILDELPTIIRKELDGEDYIPDEERSAWHGRGRAPDEMEPDGDDMSDPTDEDIVGIDGDV